jgi:hypothetical protein
VRRRQLVVIVASAAVIAIAAGASAAPGPGGWDQLGTGGTPTATALNGGVHALSADTPGVLYVGGSFTDAGGVKSADYVARWNGRAWQALGAPTLNGYVNAIAVRGGKVYVGGVFTNAGGNANADFLAVWNGTRWDAACTGPAIGGSVLALEIVGSTLYVGGSFQNGAGIATADYLLACDLANGAPRALVDVDGDFSGPVYALTADSRGVLYAGGGFINLDGIPAADQIASFRDGKWQALGSGPGPGGGALTSFVRSLTSEGTNVYVGTDSSNIAGIAQADHVAKWNGSAWSGMGSGSSGKDGWFPPSTFVNAMATSGSRVFAAGSFQNANGDPLADRIASFDGKSWRPVGSNGAGDGPLNGDVRALAAFDAKLVAGGNFTIAGGNALATFAASYPLAGAPPGGPPPTTTTTTTPAAPAPPPTGTPNGTVLVNGRPFTGGRIPYNSTVDVTRGTLVLVADTGTLTVNGAGGITAIFRLLRGTDRKRPIVELRLAGGNFSACPKRRKSSLAQTATATVRQLWGNGKGRFRTRGRFASATISGTRWLTADRCDGTLARVTQGVIQVSDLPDRRQVIVRAGRSYLATP